MSIHIVTSSEGQRVHTVRVINVQETLGSLVSVHAGQMEPSYGQRVEHGLSS